MDMPVMKHSTKNQVHSKASKPYCHAYHGNTVSAGTVVMMNMNRAGRLNGARASRAWVIEISGFAAIYGRPGHPSRTCPACPPPPARPSKARQQKTLTQVPECAE